MDQNKFGELTKVNKNLLVTLTDMERTTTFPKTSDGKNHFSHKIGMYNSCI